jgi:predicted ATPase/class 3 adenylate cyclase
MHGTRRVLSMTVPLIEQVLLFADVVDSTLLVEQLGDARASELWAEHDRHARALLATYHGREIDRADGFFLLFADALNAARFALGYHDMLAALGLRARVGLHVGAVTLRENAPDDVVRGAKPLEVDGRSKPFAARIMNLARGGQTLLSAEARAALGVLVDDVEAENHGHYRLKGFDQPVEIFELGLRGRAAFAPPADIDKAYRVVRAGDLWCPVRQVRHNLSAERDAFVGRESALRGLSRRLDAGARLLTVLGTAGTGKTRFVRRYALAWLGDWPGGVYFCDLSEARTLDGICYAVSVGLEVPLGKEPVVQLGHAIAGRGRCLVILDNFEQVVQHARATVEHWINRASDAAFVVTSRERLHLPGEETFLLGPLDLEREAVDLFCTRARAQHGDIVLDQEGRARVAEVVRLLDGLPLAIELAAARANVLSPAQLVERMRDRFRILAHVRGTAARQATLKAAIDWSWELLAPWEQGALAQCAVFEGGFRLEAAEQVLDLSAWPEAPPLAMDAVQALVDKSLLRVWQPLDQRRLELDEPWFGMYLSIHDYAGQRLAAMDADLGRAARDRHARHFARFGTDAELEALNRHGGTRRRCKLALDLDNLIAACRWAVQREDARTAVDAYRAIWEVLDLQGPYALAFELGAPVVPLAEAVPARHAIALRTRAAAARRIGRVDDAAAWLTRAIELARGAGDRAAEASCLGDLGSLYAGQGRDEEMTYSEQALALHREAGNRVAEAIVLNHLGTMCCDRGRIEEARRYYEAGLAMNRKAGNRRAECLSLANLGTLCTDIGLNAEGKEHYAAALEIAQEIGARREEGAVLGNLGMLHFAEGRLDDALTHAEAALSRAREVGDRRSEGIAIGNRGDLHYTMGHKAEARADLEIGLSIAREVGHRRHEGVMLGSLARVLAEQEHEAEADEALRDAEVLLRAIGDPFDLAGVLCLRGFAEMKAGRHEAARVTLSETEQLAKDLGLKADSALGQEISKLRNGLSR